MRDHPLLRVEDLAKHFDGAAALDGLTLSLAEGESLGITGPPGCGKTTLVDTISGFVRPDRGRVRLADRDITAWPPHRIVRAGVARTFQLPRLAVRLTVEQNLEAATLHRRLGARERARTLSRILEVIGLDDLRRREPRTLPLGEIRRVEGGRALATGARVLLLDEPCAALSPGDIPEVLSVLRRLRGEGMSMIIVAHSYTVFQALCDRVVQLEAGRIVGGGRPSELYHA